MKDNAGKLAPERSLEAKVAANRGDKKQVIEESGTQKSVGLSGQTFGVR